MTSFAKLQYAFAMALATLLGTQAASAKTVTAPAHTVSGTTGAFKAVTARLHGHHRHTARHHHHKKYYSKRIAALKAPITASIDRFKAPIPEFDTTVSQNLMLPVTFDLGLNTGSYALSAPAQRLPILTKPQMPGKAAGSANAKPPHSPLADNRLISIGHSGHTTLKYDHLGDRKYTDLALNLPQQRAATINSERRRDLSLEVHMDLETPQNGTENLLPGRWVHGQRSNQRDTARNYALIGLTDSDNRGSLSLAARAGIMNGGALHADQQLIGMMHKTSGLSGTRMSPGSTKGTPMFGTSASYAYTIKSYKVKFGGINQVKLSGLGCATAGNDKTYGAIGVSASIGHDIVKPMHQLCEGPVPVENTSGLSVALVTKVIAYDVTTDIARTQPIQSYAELAYRKKLGSNVNMTIGLVRPLSSSVAGAKRPEIANYKLAFGFRF